MGLSMSEFYKKMKTLGQIQEEEHEVEEEEKSQMLEEEKIEGDFQRKVLTHLTVGIRETKKKIHQVAEQALDRDQGGASASLGEEERRRAGQEHEQELQECEELPKRQQERKQVRGLPQSRSLRDDQL